MRWHIQTNSMGKVVLICNDKGHPIARMVDESDHANAALIAAAPALLEGLQWIADRCPAQLADHPLHDIHKEIAYDAGACARAAIAKATNQTN